MKEEIEIKLRVASPGAACGLLERLGAVRERSRVFEDNVLYDDAAGSLRSGGCVLRVREAGGEALLTFKGPKRLVEGAKSRDEHETRVASAASRP